LGRLLGLRSALDTFFPLPFIGAPAVIYNGACH
jgi:hypothetical protein